MKALVTLEWGMNVRVLTKLQSTFESLKKLNDVPANELKRISELVDFDCQVQHITVNIIEYL